MMRRWVVVSVLVPLAGCAQPGPRGGHYANATETDPAAYQGAFPQAVQNYPVQQYSGQQYPEQRFPDQRYPEQRFTDPMPRKAGLPDQSNASGPEAAPDAPPTQSPGYAEETVDDGIPPVNAIRDHDFDAPTPTRIDGARTLTTMELDGMMRGGSPPLLIDVIRGRQTVSLPNAVWLPDAGVGRDLDDDIQAWLDLHLSRLTGRDKTRPLVFFCASRFCWLAPNAVLRAVSLGYTNVFWYRGGRDAWRAAGLPLTPAPQPET